MAARFNVVTSPPSAVRPATAAHLELKDYLRFTSTCGDSSYRDKKKSVCDRWLTWKCGALSLLILIVLLITIVAYLLGKSMNIHLLLHRLNIHYTLLRYVLCPQLNVILLLRFVIF